MEHDRWRHGLLRYCRLCQKFLINLVDIVVFDCDIFWEYSIKASYILQYLQYHDHCSVMIFLVSISSVIWFAYLILNIIVMVTSLDCKHLYQRALSTCMRKTLIFVVVDWYLLYGLHFNKGVFERFCGGGVHWGVWETKIEVNLWKQSRFHCKKNTLKTLKKGVGCSEQITENIQ